nr:MAG TPA: hypothetical protein [Caudoviricetes sp.]
MQRLGWKEIKKGFLDSNYLFTGFLCRGLSACSVLKKCLLDILTDNS